ncbi:hypothetical protein B0H11DRAFT_2293754 [Mycena galericulata]|nr:hypothetical protein B0H11DRAFT_2293754 [Mycena galericulata]
MQAESLGTRPPPPGTMPSAIPLQDLSVLETDWAHRAGEVEANAKPRSASKKVSFWEKVFKRKAAPATKRQVKLPDDSPFREYSADHAQVWKYYLDSARKLSRTLEKTFSDDLDTLLIFTTLFSAILAAFLIDSTSDVSGLLRGLIEIQQSRESEVKVDFDSDIPDLVTNILWYASLLCSLMAALLATQAKGWIIHSSPNPLESSWKDAKMCERRIRSFTGKQSRPHVAFIIALGHWACLLFVVGLNVRLFVSNGIYAAIVYSLTTYSLYGYYRFHKHPVFGLDSSNTYSPLRLIPAFRKSPDDVVPERTEVHQAQILSWLLIESRDDDTIHETLCALAGLPPSPQTQDELRRQPTMYILSRFLSASSKNKTTNTTSFEACVYALLHHVQSGQRDDSGAADALRFLANNSLSEITPVSNLRPIAVTLKSRITSLLCDAPVEDVEQEELLNLIRSCTDPYLRRQLFEAHLLVHDSLRAGAELFLPLLKSENKPDCTQTHEKVVRLAAVVTDLTQTIKQGLTADAVELRRRHAALLADLTLSPSFCRLQTRAFVKEICPLLLWDDDDGRKSIVQSLIHLCAQDTTRKPVVDDIAQILTKVANQSPEVRCNVAEFLVKTAVHVDLREILQRFDFARLLEGMEAEADYLPVMLIYFVELAEYDDLKVLVNDATVASLGSKVATLSVGLDGDLDWIEHSETSGPNTQRILARLDSERTAAHTAFSGLLKHDTLRPAMAKPEIVDKIMGMLEDEDMNVQKAATSLVENCLQYDDLRTAYSTSKTLHEMVLIVEKVQRQSSTAQSVVSAVLRMSP